jgi:hypothetical protein
MNPRIRLLSSILPLGLLTGCPPLPPELVTCEEADACETTQPGSTSIGGPPTTSDGVQTVTGDDADGSDSTAAPNDGSGTDTTGTTGEAAEPPLIISRVVMPDYTDVNALLLASVTADHADGVRMLLDNGELSELTPLGAGEFEGHIEAFTGLDNGQYQAIFTPWKDAIVGASESADYVIALQKPGSGIDWDVANIEGVVAAIAILPDGRPVEFVTLQDMGMPRCYLRRREKNGDAGDFVPVLAGAHCTAIDMTIDETGVMHLLLERKSGDGLKWWAGRMSAWGAGLQNIGIGEVGDTAFALASRPGLVAVCGSTPVETIDERDALVVLLRDGQMPEERSFDYKPGDLKHQFGDTARDCAFSGDTLVIVGETNGQHADDKNNKRDRLMLIELDTAAETDPKWTVVGPGPGVESRANAVAIDDQGQYHMAGYTCPEVCAPEGEVRVYAPGGELVSQIPLGPLGSAWLGPHDIAWSPAGYAVVALGAKQGQSLVFKVQAWAPNVFVPKWTFLPIEQQGPQRALAVAVGPFGEVYAGGTSEGNHPVFVVIGG